MDQKAMRLANLLVNNSPEEAVIEMTYLGATLEFTCTCMIAITGGYFTPKVNDNEIPMYTSIMINSGDVLQLGFATDGCRAYLAIAGGLNILKVLGSKSTNLKCNIGGFHGRKLASGDCIPLCEPKYRVNDIGNRSLLKNKFIQSYRNEIKSKEITVRVILGPQKDYFTEGGISTFLTETYTITNETDRMGCKLEGTPVGYHSTVDIISDGIPLGGIQIPPNGKPIVMLADRQTTGGYAKIGTVISVDLPKFVQRKPGEKVRFEEVTLHHAQKIYQREVKQMERLRRALVE
jgi:biotin-dependent carboxylase-like uncharacterized protein